MKRRSLDFKSAREPWFKSQRHPRHVGPSRSSHLARSGWSATVLAVTSVLSILGGAALWLVAQRSGGGVLLAQLGLLTDIQYAGEAQVGQ